MNVDLHVSDRLRDGKISLYAAFLLHHQATRIGRLAYLQPAWGHRLGIRGVLRIFMDYQMARALKCEQEAKEAEGWFLSDRVLLQERRAHFLADRLDEAGSLLQNLEFLGEIARLRSEYERLPDDGGPYPSEVFPYHYAAPENELLKPESRQEFAEAKELDELSTDIYVQLCCET